MALRLEAAAANSRPKYRFDLCARLSGGAGLPAVHGRDLCRGQFDRRSLLSVVRSEGDSGMRMRANTAIGGALMALLGAGIVFFSRIPFLGLLPGDIPFREMVSRSSFRSSCVSF